MNIVVTGTGRWETLGEIRAAKRHNVVFGTRDLRSEKRRFCGNRRNKS